MLRFPGELIAAPSAFLRRLLRSLRAPMDRASRQERDAFVRAASVWIPWLTARHLSYLAFFASEAPTAGMKRAQALGWRFFNYSVFERLLTGVDQLLFFKPEPVWIRKVVRSRSTGKDRVLHIPNVPLKHLQRFVLRTHLARLQPDQAAYGFEPGRSRRSHALNHCKRAVVIRLDLRNFFPSINVEQVIPLFRECGFRSRFAEMLAHLVTFKGRLPQGAPTSPKIADLVVRPLDAVLRAVAKDGRWFYSRYADDLCFSSRRWRSRNAIDELVARVAEAASKAGFRLNRRKTRVMRRYGRQQVVGVIVNNHAPAAPREKQRRMRALVYRAERYGLLSEGSRYRDMLQAEGRDVSLRAGRHPADLVRRDRSWPYSKQVPHLPRSLRDQLTALPDEQWTAVADFWHYLCGQVGELASIEPGRSADYMTRLRRVRITGAGSTIHVPQSLEGRDQALVDRWRRIADLVAEINLAARSVEYQLIEFVILTPADQRRSADSEVDFQIFLNTLYRSLLDRTSPKYKRAIGAWLDERGCKGFRLGRSLRNYFHHGHRGEEEKRTADAQNAFHELIGVTFPAASEDWYRCQLKVLDFVSLDLDALRSWRPAAPGA